MERDKVYCGLLIGEHSFDKNNFINEIEERVISRGLDFVIINLTFVRTEEAFPSHTQFVEWAKYLGERRIPFFLVRTAQNAPDGRDSRLAPETVLAMREAAGEYFLGDSITEPGHAYAAKEAGYYVSKNGGKPIFSAYTPWLGAEDMKQAHDYYVTSVRKFVDRNDRVGMPMSVSIEATALSRYNFEAGIKMHVLETPNGDPDIMMPSIRGAVRCLGNGEPWGVLIANEWYGGMRHADMQKRKRLELIAKFSYMSGAGIITLESGDDWIVSYDQTYDHESEISQDYRNMLKLISEYARKDDRPKGGPKATFGILAGLHDGWPGFCQTSLWNQFGKEEFGHSSAEASWRLLGDVGRRRKWGDIMNYGDNDLSAYPAYGTYDIVPIESTVDKMAEYDYLVFLGWNTMTDENMDKLVEYVRRGGKLLLSAAHINYSVKRNGEFIAPPLDKLEALLGCRATGEFIRSNYGTKFYATSLDEKHIYPGTESFVCDPILSADYTTYMGVELAGGRVLGYTSNAFSAQHTGIASVIEHRIGDGLVTFVTSIDYPGSTALAPLYTALFREQVTSSARNADIRVIASDKLRYTVYEGNKIYLLNTDTDLPITVKIIYRGEEKLLTLDSLELRAVQL